MSKPMTHLEAFCSPDAINGRVWTDGCSNYKRHYNHLWIDAHKDGAWKFYDEQVAAMSDDVVWAADEPKTLTPQVALHALADGKFISVNGLTYRIGDKGAEYYSPTGRWVSSDIIIGALFRGATIATDPSQPAEPVAQPVDKDQWGRTVTHWDCSFLYRASCAICSAVDAKAEPQVEYPKSSCSCMGDASCPCRRGK